MSRLSVYHQSSPELPNKILTHLEDIASTLAAVGVDFQRWQAEAPIAPGASRDELIAAYRPQLERLMSEGGYRGLDLLSVSDDQPQAERRAQCPVEQRHGESQAHFFVAGRGLFGLHIDDYLYAVLCEKGDLLRIPAGTRHWFDRGEHPHFVAIRLSGDSPGVDAEVTGDDIASRFARLDD